MSKSARAEIAQKEGTKWEELRQEYLFEAIQAFTVQTLLTKDSKARQKFFEKTRFG